jgi:DDE superfamily endonuclease
MNAWASAASGGFSTVASIGWGFDHSDELVERLQHAPGEEARQELAATPDGPAPSRWTLRGIRATFPWLKNYTVSGVWRLLHRHGLHIRAARVRQHSPDPEYLAKLERLLECLRDAAAHPGEVEVLFLDEMGYYRWPAEGRSWAAAAPTPAPLADRDGPNNKQWRVIGALNALTGRVDYLDAYIIGRAKLVVFYRQLVAAYSDARLIYVVQDNWSIHRHEDVQVALAQLPQIEVVWLPTYAPWLNPIEKLWRWLREQVLTMHRLAGEWDALRERVNAFLSQFAEESHALLQYVGLTGEGKLAQALNDP